MGIIHNSVSIALDGINDFTDGDQTFHWDGGYIGNVDIFTPDTTPALITVTASFSGNWNMGRFSIGGETGSNIRSIVTDVATGHRYMDDMNLYGTGGNNVTLLHTDVQNFGGSEAADTLTVDSAVWMGAAQMFGGDDSVTVQGDAQIEVVNLGRGNNTLVVAGNGQAVGVQAYEGNDVVRVSSSIGPDTVSLGNGNNSLTTTGVNAFVGAFQAYDGNDSVNIGAAGAGTINLGNGNNVLTTGAGFVQAILGGDGNDIATIGDGGAGTVNLDGGNDFVTTGAGFVDAIFAGRGDDIVHVGPGGVDAGVGYVNLGRGTNLLTVQNIVDVVFAGQNDDTITIGSGGSVGIIHLGGGNDTLNLGSSGSPTVTDSGGFDTVTTTISRDLGHGSFSGVEKLTLLGGGAINGRGNELNNIITGNNKANTLEGADGQDTLFGFAGNDTLIGGHGKDTMTGGLGNDIFHYDGVGQSPRGAGADVIKDFDDFGNDRIDLRDVFGGTLQYIHNAAFSAAGQVRINDVAGPDVIVQVNTFGTSVAEMEIRLSHTTLGSMNAGDFFL
jgi:hypothetical protein